jgi:hypothetical protein
MFPPFAPGPLKGLKNRLPARRSESPFSAPTELPRGRTGSCSYARPAVWQVVIPLRHGVVWVPPRWVKGPNGYVFCRRLLALIIRRREVLG